MSEPQMVWMSVRNLRAMKVISVESTGTVILFSLPERNDGNEKHKLEDVPHGKASVR